jgi:hypothetical protein
MTEKRFALRVAAGFAGMVMAASLAATPAFADGESDRGRSAEAHENAPGQAKREEAGNRSDPAHPDGEGTPPAHAGGPAAQTPPPGRTKPQDAPARPAKPARPARPAKPRPARPARPAKPAHPVHAATPANPHAKAGKTTICHATGSATNPYVTITISDNALPAHARHQDGRDLIPAPAGGCPAAAPATAEAGRGASTDLPAAAKKDAPAAPATGQVRGFTGASAHESPMGGVLGVIAEGGAAPSALPPLRDTIAEKPALDRRESGAPAARKASAGELPFTGLEAAVVALLGMLLVLMGILFRQLSGRASIA